MSERRCVIVGCKAIGEHQPDCAATRCRGCQPRLVEHGLVCNSDRTRLAAWLDELPALHAELDADPDPVDRREWTVPQWRPIPTADPSRKAPWQWVREPGSDPLAKILPMGITRTSNQARVSGSREAPVPVNLDRLDLAAKARPASLALFARGQLGLDPDQIGTLSTETILDSWVRDWRNRLWPGHHLPVPTVAGLVSWLSTRLDDACDRYEDIHGFADAIAELRHSLRGALQLTATAKELCWGVSCRSCDRVNVLYRESGLVSCGYCGLNYSEQEYREWVGLLAGQAGRTAAA